LFQHITASPKSQKHKKQGCSGQRDGEVHHHRVEGMDLGQIIDKPIDEFHHGVTSWQKLYPLYGTYLKIK
jgi:hypothetical protein